MLSKLLMFSFSLLFLAASFSIAQVNTNLKWLHEKPQGNTIRWVKVWDENNWYAAGYSGTFMKTSDAGNSWYITSAASRPRATTGFPNTLYSGYFFNKDTGFVLGTNSSLLLTTNAGETFDTVSGLPQSCTFYQAWFVNRQIGWICGSSTAGRMMKTTDGGLTWALNATIPSGSFYDVWCTPDGQTIVAASSGGNVVRSTDGGTTWNSISTGTSSTLYKLNFWSATTGMVCGSAGAVRLTTNAGATWTSVNTGLATTNIFYYLNYDNGTVYLTGATAPNNTIYKTTNNGTSWESMNIIPASQTWTSTYYTADCNAGVFLAAGGFGLINSKINENIKCYTTLVKPGTIYDIWANNTGKIITVGAPTSTGSIFDQFMISTDGGTSWSLPTVNKSGYVISPQYIPSQEPIEDGIGIDKSPTSLSTFRSLKMIDDNTGYAVGSFGAVFKTTNGGINWDSLVTPIPATQSLMKVEFIDASTGWIFSQTGIVGASQIWKTTDAGNNWTLQSYPTSVTSERQINSASMVNANYGWVLPIYPYPWKTTDGGATWSKQSLSTSFTGNCYQIQMLDTTTGFISGDNGNIFRTTNGGASWDSVPSPTTGGTWYSMKWKNKDVGIVGGGSISYMTTNGGTTWSLNITGGSTNYGIYLSGTDTINVFMVGTAGCIYKWTNMMSTPASTTFQLSVSVSNDWNMVSVPGLHPVNQNVNTWWINKNPLASVYKFIPSGYIPVTDCTPGIGYWMNHSGNQVYNTGEEWPSSGILFVAHTSLVGNIDWNMIGGYDYNAPTSGITTTPPGLQNALIYGYSSITGYTVADALVPGYGYWMRLTGAGLINLPPSSFTSLVSKNNIDNGWGRIILTDNSGRHYTLYAVNGNTNTEEYLLPPAPVNGLFDVRYGSGTFVENISEGSVHSIDFTGVDYPVTIKAENLSLILEDQSGKELYVKLNPGEQLKINESPKHKLLVHSASLLAPITYQLDQNYPNPFNPSTTIRFSIPELTNVKLTVYNLLGEKVTELVNGNLKPGKYSYQWEAQGFSSGLYLYELRTGAFTSTRKMLLLK